MKGATRGSVRKSILRPLLALGLLAVLGGFSTGAWGQTSGQPLGLNADLGYASAYVWRGLNKFQGSGQMDQNMLVAPGVTYAVPLVPGLSAGYWGAFQVSGGGIGGHIDSGRSAQQDLIFAYAFPFGPVSAAAGLTGYFYPFADKDSAGASFPVYLEPSLAARYNYLGFDAGLALSYYHGIQSGISETRHLYLNPTVSRSFQLTSQIGLVAGAGFGYKLYNSGNGDKDNNFDVLLKVSAPIAVRGPFYAAPSVQMGWTNLNGKGFGSELAVWGGLNIGANL